MIKRKQIEEGYAVVSDPVKAGTDTLPTIVPSQAGYILQVSLEDMADPSTFTVPAPALTGLSPGDWFAISNYLEASDAGSITETKGLQLGSTKINGNSTTVPILTPGGMTKFLVNDDSSGWVIEGRTLPDEILEETGTRATGSDFPDDKKQVINAKQIFVKNASGKADFNRERNLGVYDVANYADHYDDFGANGTTTNAAERTKNADAVNAALADARAKGGSATIVLPRTFDMDGGILLNRPDWHLRGESNVEVVCWSGSIKIDGDSYGDWMRGNKVTNLNVRRRDGGGPAIEVLNNGADTGPTFNSPIEVLLKDIRVLSVPPGNNGISWKGGFQGQMVRCYLDVTGTGMNIGIDIDTVTGIKGGVAANALEIIGGEVKGAKTGFSVKNSFNVGFSGNFVVQGCSELGGYIGEGNNGVNIDNCYFEKNGTAPAATATDQNTALVIGEDSAGTESTTRNTTIKNSLFITGPLDHMICVNKAKGIFIRDNYFSAGTHSVLNKRPTSTFTTGKMSGGYRSNLTTPNNHIKNDFGGSSLTYIRESQPYSLNLTATERVLEWSDDLQQLRSTVANTDHPVTIPTAASENIPVGFECELMVLSNNSKIVITPATGVQLRQAGGTIGPYTHDRLYGTVTLRKSGTNVWVIKEDVSPKNIFFWDDDYVNDYTASSGAGGNHQFTTHGSVVSYKDKLYIANSVENKGSAIDLSEPPGTTLDWVSIDTSEVFDFFYRGTSAGGATVENVVSVNNVASAKISQLATSAGPSRVAFINSGPPLNANSPNRVKVTIELNAANTHRFSVRASSSTAGTGFSEFHINTSNGDISTTSQIQDVPTYTFEKGDNSITVYATFPSYTGYYAIYAASGAAAFTGFTTTGVVGSTIIEEFDLNYRSESAGPYVHEFVTADWVDAATAYPALPASVTTGKLALPVLAAATHGKGVTRMVTMYHSNATWSELSIPAATNRRFIDPTDDGAIAVIIDAGTAFDGELRVRT